MAKTSCERVEGKRTKRGRYQNRGALVAFRARIVRGVFSPFGTSREKDVFPLPNMNVRDVRVLESLVLPFCRTNEIFALAKLVTDPR